MKKWLVIATLVIMMFSCTSKGSEKSAQVDADMRKDYRAGWYSLITLNNAGTRSEGRTYELYHAKQAIPYQFEVIFAGGQGFRFRQKLNLWDSAGYVPVDDVLCEQSKDTINKDEITKGFYYGKAWKQGTPEHWFMAVRGEVAAFIAPEKLQEFLWQYDWKALPLTKVELLPVSP